GWITRLEASQEKIKDALGTRYTGERWQIRKLPELLRALEEMEVDQDILRSIGFSGLVLTENQGILARVTLDLPKTFDFCLAWQAIAHITMSCELNRTHVFQALLDPSWTLCKRITSMASETRKPADTVAVAIEYEIALEDLLGVIIERLDNGANIHVNLLKQCWLADFVSVGLLEREDDLKELRPRQSNAVQSVR
ncbi:MAG: hypothetical protein LQ345_005701, partial [Seirophora villosa]